MEAPREPTPIRRTEPGPDPVGPGRRRFAPPPSTPAASGRVRPFPRRDGEGTGARGAPRARAPVVIKGRTVGHGGRTMTFRVWPIWTRALAVMLGAGLVALAVVAARSLDAEELRRPFGLTLPGQDHETTGEGQERPAGWTTRPATVPVLMYRLAEGPLDAEGFAAHLAVLQGEGFTAITASDYVAALDGATLPERPVLITVDGPAAGARELVPVLGEFGMVATFFLPPTGDDDGAASLVRSLLDHGEVGGQTAGGRPLSELPASDQAKAIAESRRWLEEASGRTVVAFAYPDGDYDEHTVPALEEAGYRIAFDAWGGLAPVTDPATNRWHLQRIPVDPSASPDALLASLKE